MLKLTINKEEKYIVEIEDSWNHINYKLQADDFVVSPYNDKEGYLVTLDIPADQVEVN